VAEVKMAFVGRTEKRKKDDFEKKSKSIFFSFFSKRRNLSLPSTTTHI